MEVDGISIPEGEALTREMAEIYRVYQTNILRTEVDQFRLAKGAKGDLSERELLEIALEALDRCIFSPEELPEASGKGT